MSGLTSALASPTWWISTVVVAVLMNLFSSYLRTWLDRGQHRRSERAARRSDEDRARYAAELQEIRANSNILEATTLKLHRMQFHVLTSQLFLIFAMLAFRLLVPLADSPLRWLGLAFLCALGLVAIVDSALMLLYLRESNRLASLLSDALEEPIDTILIRKPFA